MKRVASILLLLLAASAGAEAIYGHSAWNLSFPEKTFTQTGPLFFGTLPEGEISEIARTSARPEFLPPGPGNYDFDIPIPVYGDGTAASLDELLVIPHLRGAEELIAIGGATFWMDIAYFGTGSLDVDYGGLFDGSGVITLEIEVLAFRRGPAGNGADPGPFTGEWTFDFIYPYDFVQEGPQLFGHPPLGEITEIAFASSVEIVSAPGATQQSASLPVPRYADGSAAAEDEILFTVHMRELGREPTYLSFSQSFAWSGGGEIAMAWTGDRIESIEAEVEIRAWAFRRGATAAESMSFGRVKRMYR